MHRQRMVLALGAFLLEMLPPLCHTATALEAEGGAIGRGTEAGQLVAGAQQVHAPEQSAWRPRSRRRLQQDLPPPYSPYSRDDAPEELEAVKHVEPLGGIFGLERHLHDFLIVIAHSAWRITWPRGGREGPMSWTPSRSVSAFRGARCGYGGGRESCRLAGRLIEE